MSDLRNTASDDDHDRVVNMAARLGIVEREMEGLRDWRHNTVSPIMMSIQGQQKNNADMIGKLGELLEKVIASMEPLRSLPADFREHLDDDKLSNKQWSDGIAALDNKMDANSIERGEQHRRLIYWVAGLLIVGLGSVVGAQWAFISPHLNWH